MAENDLDTSATETVASTPVAPPLSGDQPVSTPAPPDTGAQGQAAAEGETPEQKQSRRDARAFATQRRENRELSRQLGRMEAELEAVRASGAPTQTPDGQPRPTISPAQIVAQQRDAEAARTVVERLEDAGDEIEGFDKVMQTITGRGFPMTVGMRDYLGVSDKPAQMAVWLSDNPEEARRISLLSDAVQVRALERAEAKLGASSKSAPRTTNAPPPARTVGGSSTPSDTPRTMSMDDYAERWRKRPSQRG